MKNTTLIRGLCASVMVAFSFSQATAQGTINTIAGTGIATYGGDGGLAISASFDNPSGVATDGGGNIFIADYNNHRVRKIDGTTGIVSTVAGNGSWGYSGMGGPAVTAGMEYPNSMFVDNTGKYYLTDFFADCAYEVGSTGDITNVVGHNSQGDDGDGGCGNLARMKLPKGVWKDNHGNLLLADYGSNRLRKMNGASTIMETVTGPARGFSPNGTPAASCAWGSITGVCSDNYGNIYVSDGGNHVVRKIDASGNVRTIAGNGIAGYSGDGGPAVNATLGTPGALFINSAGYLFICDNSSNVVRVVNVMMAAGSIKTLAGNGTMGFSGDLGLANAAQLNQPSGIWEDASGTIYIADAGNQRIRTVVGSGYKTAPNGISLSPEVAMNIFPNPTSGTFTVQTNTLLNNATLEVYNVVGVKVLAQAISQQQTVVKLDQPSGMYTMMLKSATTATVSQRVVIAK